MWEPDHGIDFIGCLEVKEKTSAVSSHKEKLSVPLSHLSPGLDHSCSCRFFFLFPESAYQETSHICPLMVQNVFVFYVALKLLMSRV